MKFKSALVTEASGRIGGMVASHNRGGNYFRAASPVVNPNTPLQSAVRAIFGALVQAWTIDLSQAERDAWDTYASNTPRTGPLGDELILTGQQAFIGSNTPRIQAGLARVDAAPVINDTGAPVTSVTDFSATPDIDVALAVGASAAGNVLTYVGESQNASIKFYKGPYRFASSDLIISGATSLTITPAVVSGPYVAAQVRPVRVRISYGDGRLSQAYDTLSTLSAGV